jgi:hypothetical protein
MDMFGWGARMAGRMSRMSPAGLFLMGGAAVLAFPSVRHGLRSVAVIATRGVLSAADAMQSSVAAMRENMEDIVAEARAAADEDGTLMAAARTHGRRMAVGTAAGMMAVGEGLRGIVEEARSSRQEAVHEDEPGPMLATLGTDEHARAEEPADDESPAPRRRRSRSQEQ